MGPGRVLIRFARRSTAMVTLLVVSILMIDVAAWYGLPPRFAVLLPGYRQPFFAGVSGGRGKYPNGYFMAHPERGFDIAPNVRGTHFVEGLTYPVWSNQYGCFDDPWERPPRDYDYFAGDSMTWGYSPYDTKFATVFQARTGIDTVKCGVTHTGTLHQFAKFREVTARIGTLPKKVFVGYFHNDTADDFAHPVATVERGWLVDAAYVDRDMRLVRVDHDWIARQVDDYLATRSRESVLAKRLLEYSFTAQVVAGMYERIRNVVRPPRPFASFERGTAPDGRTLYDLNYLTRLQGEPGYLAYTSFEPARRNREALVRWQEDADARGYELVVLLFETSDYYREVQRFLAHHHVAYISLPAEFRKRGLRDKDLYWPIDGHFSPYGNRMVGEILADLETGRAAQSGERLPQPSRSSGQALPD
jgi:hypothetical protein